MVPLRSCHAGGKVLRQVLLRGMSSVKSGKTNVGIGFVDDGVHRWEQIRLGILGAPFYMGQPHHGTEKSPSLIRQRGIVDRLKELGHDVKDFGDLDHFPIEENVATYQPERLHYPANNVEYARQVSSLFGLKGLKGQLVSKLSNEVERIIRDERLLLTIGGDHSIGMATIHGHLRVHRDACVLWVDAHGDINTPYTALSGHMHGMPLSFNIKELASVQPEWPNMEWFQPLLDANRLAFIGLRDVDPLERTILDRLKIPAYSMREIDEMGIREVVKCALNQINPHQDRALHVSFDIDALDSLEAPATGTPVRGGLTLREGMTILEDCFMTGNLRALDLVEVNVHLGHYDDGTKTLEASKHLILSAMGYYRGGRPPLAVAIEKAAHWLPQLLTNTNK